MSGRQLVGGAAVLVVLGAVLWYVGLAPSRGTGVAPDAGVRVAISATVAGSGSWERYVISVRNLADGDFAGDVLLMDTDQQGDSAPQPQSQPLATLPSSVRVPSVPAVPAESAYRLHLTVPSRTERDVAVLAPDFFSTIEAVMGGTVLDQEPVDRPATIPVAVLSDVEQPATDILKLHYDQFGTSAAEFNRVADFPTSAMQLAGYAALVIDRFDTATLSQLQMRTIRDFVGFGGTLVLAGGTDWRRTIAPMPGDLLPVHPNTTKTMSLAPVAALAGGGPSPLSVDAAIGPLSTGATALVDGDGGPLASWMAYGEGQVVELAWDPEDPGLTTSPYPQLGWGQALGRALTQPPGSAPTAVTLLGPDRAFTALLPAPDDPPLPPLWLMTGILVAYVALVGPGAYLLVTRRWGRPALFWAIVPAAAVLFTGAFYAAGNVLQGGLQDQEIQVLRVGPNRTVDALEYDRILFLHRGDHTVVPAANSLVAPLTLETFQTTGSTCERCTSQLGGLPSGVEHARPDPVNPSVDESGVVYGSVRVIASSQLGSAPIGLTAQLSSVGGHIQGTVANPGALPVAELELFTSDGQTVHEADLAPLVQSGDAVDVNAALVDPETASRPQSADAVLLRAVAESALSGRGRAVLVAMTVPVSSRLTVDGSPPSETTGVAVLQQAITLTSADGTLRDLERKSLASAGGDQQHGFADVYDIQVPATNAPLVLTWNAQWAAEMEVWDWTQGTFVSLPAPRGGAVGTVSLPASDVRNGLVRIRMGEPRLSWGSNVWVDAASAG